MSHDAFLHAIHASPADDLPRLVYADWLEENNDAPRAEFIRVQCELATIDAIDPQRAALEDREHALLNEHEDRWLGKSRPHMDEWEFARGFVQSLTADPYRVFDDFLHEHTAEIGTFRDIDVLLPWGRCWPNRVTHADCSGWLNHIDRLHDHFSSGWPRLKSLDLLRLHGLANIGELFWNSPIRDQLTHIAIGGRNGNADGDTIDETEFLELFAGRSLESLTAYDCGLTGDGLGYFLAAFTKLKQLDISDNPIAPDAWRAFVQADPAIRLERLDVSGTPLAGISLHRVLGSRACENLKQLEMNRCGSARLNMVTVANSRFWTQATELRAHGGTIPASTLEPLCLVQGPPSLRVLDLDDNYLRTEGVRMLCEAPWADGLTWLSVSRNYLDDVSLQVLAQSGRFPHLNTLHLSHNNLDLDETEGELITHIGIRTLVESACFANLRILTLANTGIAERSVEAILNEAPWRLSGLGIASCQLRADTARMIATSPRLARLNWLDLSNNHLLGGDALLPLAESPYLSRLCELDIRGIPVSDKVRNVLRERLGVRLSD